MATTFDKPAGLPVFPPHDDPAGDCVLARLLAAEPARADVGWPGGFECGIAHRLDTSTSGALLVADGPDELARIRERFRDGALRKTYLARLSAPPPFERAVCDLPVGHSPKNPRKMIVQRGPRTACRGRWYPAHTEVRALGDDLVEVVITTGVTHQIRVHLAALGLPLLGDVLYRGAPSPDDAPPGVTFFLHHVGLEGPGVRTEPVQVPAWASHHAMRMGNTAGPNRKG